MNLIIDHHNFVLRSLFTYKDKGMNMLDDPMDASRFAEKLLKDFERLYFYYKPLNIKRVIFTEDSTSWRKQYTEEYKAKRKSDQKVNWKNFYGVIMPEIKKKLSKYAYFSKMSPLESDDLIIYWVDEFKKRKENSIILSSDRDLDQLVYKNDDSWCIKINLIGKKIYASENYVEWLGLEDTTDEIEYIDKEKGLDLFISGGNILEDQYDPEKDFIKELSKDYKFVPINRNKFLLEKIIKGDSSDNIRSIYFHNKRGIGEKGAQKYVAKYPDFEVPSLYEDYFIDSLAQRVFEDKKQKVPKKHILEAIKLNINLMLLETEIIEKNNKGISEKVQNSIDLLLNSDSNLNEIKRDFTDEVLTAIKFDFEETKAA